ncbi:MAG: molecular chaperone DnaJ [Acidimicrobiales bacterium]
MAVQREWLEKDYYQVLGVPSTASEKDVTSAYRKLAKKLHPDANPNDASAEERFKDVSAAYDVVGDPAKRKEYDEARRLGVGVGGGGGGFGRGGGGFGAPGGVRFDYTDLSDLLGGAFGRRKPTGGAKRGSDLEAELHLSFAEAVAGIETSVNLTSDVACGMCSGSGAAPGTSPVICGTCGSRGVIDDNQGLFGFSRPCPACRGTGMRVETPCPTCNGSGVARKSRRIKVRIPAGVQDGQRVVFKQRGDAGRDGGPPGDLYVRVQVAPDSRFGRKGNDLTVTVPISFADAALGATLAAPTMDGSVTLRVPPGTPGGRTFRVRGKGVKGGDLLVTVEVAIPKALTDEQRHLVEQLREAMEA